jgi:hypothetical protein
MLTAGRDLVAVIGLEKRLGQLRERIADRIIAHQPMTAEETAAAEQEIQAGVKRDFYTAASRGIVKPKEVGISDDQDYADRGQRLAEHGVWFSHRGLLAIPLVGDPAFSDPAPEAKR